MAPSEWVFPMKMTTVSQKQLTKEKLLSDQSGTAHQRKKLALMLCTAAEEGLLSVARRRRRATFERLKLFGSFRWLDRQRDQSPSNGDISKSAATRRNPELPWWVLERRALRLLLLHFLNQTCVNCRRSRGDGLHLGLFGLRACPSQAGWRLWAAHRWVTYRLCQLSDGNMFWLFPHSWMNVWPALLQLRSKKLCT